MIRNELHSSDLAAITISFVIASDLVPGFIAVGGICFCG